MHIPTCAFITKGSVLLQILELYNYFYRNIDNKYVIIQNRFTDSHIVVYNPQGARGICKYKSNSTELESKYRWVNNTIALYSSSVILIRYNIVEYCRQQLILTPIH